MLGGDHLIHKYVFLSFSCLTSKVRFRGGSGSTVDVKDIFSFPHGLGLLLDPTVFCHGFYFCRSPFSTAWEAPRGYNQFLLPLDMWSVTFELDDGVWKVATTTKYLSNWDCALAVFSTFFQPGSYACARFPPNSNVHVIITGAGVTSWDCYRRCLGKTFGRVNLPELGATISLKACTSFCASPMHICNFAGKKFMDFLPSVHQVYFTLRVYITLCGGQTSSWQIVNG